MVQKEFGKFNQEPKITFSAVFRHFLAAHDQLWATGNEAASLTCC